MAHSSDKPKREKRKPKKEKVVLSKPARDSEVIEHIQHGTHPGQELR